MNDLSHTVEEITKADSVELGEVIQHLWSGYGVIQRAVLRGLEHEGGNEGLPVVIKHIDISQVRGNPRGWGNKNAHHRKVNSYKVEKAFYEQYADRCSEGCVVPSLIATHEKPDAQGWLIILSDLNSQGFAERKHSAETPEIEACLAWLAHFHATFLGAAGGPLWPIGTYWHLATRPDELKAMPSGPLKDYAKDIDQRLDQAKYKTLVHGDAKIANFCFSDSDRPSVAAVDFQYVGGGCGIKDVAYLISSCLSEQEAESLEEYLLEFYFHQLREALSTTHPEIPVTDLELEWRELYTYAWADFCRFLQGWSPGHWKLNHYSNRVTRSVIKRLDHESDAF
ncbi:MAG: phosphotransferase [Planctomycetota bacterium]|nr:phosphotransferase [Planctomycetota bacterium]